MDFLISGITSITPQQIVMYVIGAVLIWLAINKDLEPVLLLPLGFGAILVNLPASGVLNQTLAGIGETNGIIEWLFNVGIEASEAMPLLLFIGIGAMIDFGPLLSNPKLFLFGAAAQFGIFAAIVVACFLGFDLKDAASIGIIGATRPAIKVTTIGKMIFAFLETVAGLYSIWMQRSFFVVRSLMTIGRIIGTSAM